MSYSGTEIAGNILKRSFEEKTPVTPMKLQRLLFITAVKYYKSTNRQLLNEEFQAWLYGPVLPSLYAQYQNWPTRTPINKYPKNANGESFIIREKDDPELAKTLNTVWLAFSGWKDNDLSDYTRTLEGYWLQAWNAKENSITIS